MGKKRRKRTTDEERARWDENERRLYELANRGLEKLGMTARSSTASSACRPRRSGIRARR
jgi:hypothetical protein